MEWMAFAQTFGAEPGAAQSAVTLDGFEHVFGAGGPEAARGGKQRGDHGFVSPEGAEEERCSQALSLPTAVFTSGVGASASERRGLKTIHQ
jgi:hypothetical protein